MPTLESCSTNFSSSAFSSFLQKAGGIFELNSPHPQQRTAGIRRRFLNSKSMKKNSSPCHNSLTVHSRSPLRYRCRTCNRTYAARHGEISFGSKLTPDEVLSLLALLKKRLSIRKISELSQLSPSTVERWKQRFVTQKLLFDTLTTTTHECI